MNLTDSIINYRRHLKRKNYSPHTLRSYLNNLKQFVVWLDEPVEQVTDKKIAAYIDFLLDRRIAPKTINCHLVSIRDFYDYLRHSEGFNISNPVKRGSHLRLARPLPKHLKDQEVIRFLKAIDNLRDQAIFMLMLRSGLRVTEVANLTLDAIDWRRQRLYVYHGKGAKDRVVYISNDSYQALRAYVKQRLSSCVKKVFLVERGVYKGKPISVRGIQKRIEYYAKASGLKVSCHHLRHTMATQLLNADAALVSIQDILGHTRIKTTQRYCRISNLKVQKDYYKAMAVVIQKTSYGQGA